MRGRGEGGMLAEIGSMRKSRDAEDMNKLLSTAAARTIGAVHVFLYPGPLTMEGQMRVEQLLGLVSLQANRASTNASNVYSM